MRNAVSARILMFLVTLFGGLDWMMAGSLMTDCEWWQARLFRADTQVTAFYTAQVVVIHHFLSFYSMLIAYAVFFYSRVAGGGRWKALLVLLLCALAFYASPYPVLSAPFVAAIHYRVVLRRLVLSWAMPIVLVAALVPLSLYCGRLPDQGFGFCTFRLPLTGNYLVDGISRSSALLLVGATDRIWRDSPAPFPAHPAAGADDAILPAGQHCLLRLHLHRGRQKRRQPSMAGYVLADLRCVCHFRLLFRQTRTHTLRGQIPTCGGRGVQADRGGGNHRHVAVFGPARRHIAQLYQPGKSARRTPFAGQASSAQAPGSRDIAQNRSIKQIDYRPEYGDRRLLVNAEKLLSGVPVEDMAVWERQRARTPTRWLLW